MGEGRVKVYYQAVGRVKLLALRATKPSCLEGRLAGAMGRFPESLVWEAGNRGEGWGLVLDKQTKGDRRWTCRAGWHIMRWVGGP